METKIDEVVIKGIKYIPESEVPKTAESLEGMPYKIFRTYSSGDGKGEG